MNEQYTFEIGPDLRRAREALEKFAKTTQDQLNSINMKVTVSSIRDGFAIAQRAIRPFVNLIGESITEALRAEQEQRNLANSMRIVGDFSQAAFDNLKNYSDELARNTSLSGGQAMAALALAKTYSLTNKEAMEVVRVGADLSALTGDSLNTSVEKLAKSYNGFLDKQLKQLRPELKKLTEEQLANGEAVRILGQFVDGTASKLQQGMGGALNEVSKASTDFKTAIGQLVTQSSALEETVRFVATSIRFVTENMDAFAYTIERVASSLPGLGGAVSIFLAIRDAIGLASDKSGELLSDIEKIRLAQSNATAEREAEARIKRERAANVAEAKAITEFNGIRASLEKAGLTQIEEINKEAQRRIRIVRDAASAGIPEAVAKQEQYIASIRIDAAKRVAKIQSDLDKKVLDSRANIEGIVTSKLNEVTNAPLTGLIEFAIKGQDELDKTKAKIDATLQELIQGTDIAPAIKRQMTEAAEVFKNKLDKGFNTAVVAGLASNLLRAVRRGAEGAADIIAKGVGAVASIYFGKEVGAIVEEFTSFLAQGSDAVKKQVTEFERAVPQVIQNIIEAIPALFEAMIDNMPYVIEKSIEMIPKIFSAWLNFLPKLFNKIIEMLPRIITSFVQGFIKAIPEMFRVFGQALYDSAVQFVEALMKAITDIGGGIGKGLGISDGKSGDGNGFIGQLLDPLGIFAEGGRVPDDPRFSGDRFPARLDAGEQVFSRDLTKRLENFLDQGGGAQGPGTVVIKVGEAELARVLLNLNRGGFRTA